MEKYPAFLKKFPKDKNKLYIVYDLFTFDNLFRLLLANNFDHKEALYFMFANCSLSAHVFQQRIHNKKYKKLSAKDALSVDDAVRRTKVIYDVMRIAQGHH